MDPFELKDELIRLARSSARRDARTLLNAGRGNPDWLAIVPREAFFLLGGFAVATSRVAEGGLAPGRAATRAGIAARFKRYLRDLPDSPGRRLLRAILADAVRNAEVDTDDFVLELTDGIAGNFYPEPVRILPHVERIVLEYLVSELCGGVSPRGNLELFAVEGATAGICYVFDTLIQNGLLKKGDRIALAVPIFAPYVELPELDRYAFDVVQIQASERNPDGSHAWQYPDSEIDKLHDPTIKALFIVNPSNPPSVSMQETTMRRLAALVRRRRPDLIIISDDVYAPFVDGYRSLLSILPKNVICLYSFSKYFGATGWRLGVVVIHQHFIGNRLMSDLPAARRKAIDSNYRHLVADPRKLGFAGRLVADSRRVALKHTAGLSTPQQIQMALLAYSEKHDRSSRYRRHVRDMLAARLRALYAGLNAPLDVNPLRAGYYCELDLMRWAASRHGAEFAHYLRQNHDPLDMVLTLAQESSIVLLPCAGFAGPAWSVRVSLANVPEEACRKIGRAIAGLTERYVRQWRSVRDNNQGMSRVSPGGPS
jgi:aspartate 4-decarboxylase